jgi:hypothetical protein
MVILTMDVMNMVLNRNKLNSYTIKCLIMKKIGLFIISLLAAINLHTQNPVFEWVKTNQGYFGNAYGRFIEMDANGNIYNIGLLSGTVDFDPSLSNASWLTASTVGYTWYMQKLDSNGDFIWVRSIHNSQGSVGSIKVDDSGDLYITGKFKDTIDLDPSYMVYNLVSQGGWDVFILKLSSTGNFIWAKSFGGISDDHCGSLCIDPQRNVYSHGYFTGIADFDPGPGTFYLSSLSNNGPSAFIQKLDNNGNFIWAKAFIAQDITGMCNGKSIDLDSDGNIYCAGYFQGSVDFDPGPGINVPSSNSMGVYITKLDSSGNLLWLRHHTYVGSWGYGVLNSMVLDRYNNVYATGRFSGNVDFDPGPDTLLLTNSTFIQKLDKNGNFKWAKSYGFGDNPNSITVDTFGNIYSTGIFVDSTNLAPGPDTLVFYTQSVKWASQGAYLQKLNSNGDLLWAGVLQGNRGISNGFDVVSDNAGNVFFTGDYKDTVDFDPGLGIYNQITPNSNTASYIIKLSQCKVLTTNNVTTCDSLTWMDGITYHQSTQSAYFTLPSSAGCDSIICLSLTIPVIDTTVSVSPHGVFNSNQHSASYQWLDCNNGYAALPGDTMQTFNPIVNGDYAVVINLYGCVDTSACVHIGNVGIEEIEGSRIRLYPNPNSGKFILDMGNAIATEVRILNSLGQEIIALQDITTPSFDLDLKPGIYFLQIRTGHNARTMKFVVR